MIRFFMPYPPTVNHYWDKTVTWRGRSPRVHVYLSEKGKDYRAMALATLADQGIAGRQIRDPVRLDILVAAPDNRTRDLDNLTKGMFDALVHAYVLKDDKLIKGFNIDWAVSKIRGGAVQISLEESYVPSRKISM